MTNYLSAPPKPPRKPKLPKINIKLPTFKLKKPKKKVRVVKKPRRPVKATTTTTTTVAKPTAIPTARPTATKWPSNESFRQERGVNNFVNKVVDDFEPFKPSLRDSLYLDNLVGKWIPG